MIFTGVSTLFLKLKRYMNCVYVHLHTTTLLHTHTPEYLRTDNLTVYTVERRHSDLVPDI